MLLRLNWVPFDEVGWPIRLPLSALRFAILGGFEGLEFGGFDFCSEVVKEGLYYVCKEDWQRIVPLLDSSVVFNVHWFLIEFSHNFKYLSTIINTELNEDTKMKTSINKAKSALRATKHFLATKMLISEQNISFTPPLYWTPPSGVAKCGTSLQGIKNYWKPSTMAQSGESSTSNGIGCRVWHSIVYAECSTHTTGTLSL